MTHDPTQFNACAWREAFDAFVRDRMPVPFKWGANDCCLYAADAVLAATGIDHAAEARGSYSTAREAVDVLARLGGLEALGSRAGPECPPLTAGVGDIGLVNDGERDALAVCQGEMWLVPGRDGIGALPFNAAKRAWRVAHG